MGRNDPCLCGSGKKYKHCCLKVEEAKLANGHAGTAPKALNWLFEKYGPEVRDTLLTGFYGGLNDDKYTQIQNLPEDVCQAITVNAMEWLLAEGLVTIRSRERRVIDLLFDKGAPLFSIEQEFAPIWVKSLSLHPFTDSRAVRLPPTAIMPLAIISTVRMLLHNRLLPAIRASFIYSINTQFIYSF